MNIIKLEDIEKSLTIRYGILIETGRVGSYFVLQTLDRKVIFVNETKALFIPLKNVYDTSYGRLDGIGLTVRLSHEGKRYLVVDA